MDTETSLCLLLKQRCTFIPKTIIVTASQYKRVYLPNFIIKVETQTHRRSVQAV